MPPRRRGPARSSFSTAASRIRTGRSTRPPPSGVPISGEFGCVKTSAYPGLNCPLYPLPLNFVYNDLEMATPTVHHFNVSFQRQLTNDIMVDVAYVGRYGYKLEGHRHFNPAQFINSPRTGASARAEHQRARHLRARDHRPDIARARDAYQSWYRPRVKGHQAHGHGFMFSGFYTLSKAEDALLDQGAGLTAASPIRST